MPEIKGIYDTEIDACDKRVQFDSSSHKVRVVQDTDGVSYILKEYEVFPISQGESGASPSISFFGQSTAHKSRRAVSKEVYPYIAGQLESFYSKLYQFLLGIGAAKTVPLLHKDKGSGVVTCIGSLSQVLPGFESARNQSIDFFNLKRDLAAILCASYVLGEDDFHKGNFGTFKAGSKTKRLARVDYDMSGWFNMAELKGARIISTMGLLFPAPKDAFKIHPEDIIDFPDIRHAHPFYWPTANCYYFDDAQDFVNLKHDIEFNRYKYLYFYLFSIMPDALLWQFADDCIQEPFKEYSRQHGRSIIERQQKIKEILRDQRAFLCAMLNEGDFKKEGFDSWEFFEEHIREFGEASGYDVEDVLEACRSTFKNDIKAYRKKYDAIDDPDKGLFPNKKNYEPFLIPNNYLKLYLKRKEKICSKLEERLEREEEKLRASSFSLKGLKERSKDCYDKGVRGEAVKDTKVKWLKRVIAKAEADIKKDQQLLASEPAHSIKEPMRSLLNWFAVRNTPKYVMTGSTGKLIKEIREGEDEFGKILRMNCENSDKLALLLESNSKIDEFESGLLSKETKEDSALYFAVIKSVFVDVIKSHLKEHDYDKTSLTDFKGLWYRDMRKEKKEYWTRIKNKIPKVNDWDKLRRILEPQKGECRENVIEGTSKDRYEQLVGILRLVRKGEYKERSHAIKWLEKFKQALAEQTGGYLSGGVSPIDELGAPISKAMAELAQSDKSIMKILNELEKRLKKYGYGKANEESMFHEIHRHFEACRQHKERLQSQYEDDEVLDDDVLAQALDTDDFGLHDTGLDSFSM